MGISASTHVVVVGGRLQRRRHMAATWWCAGCVESIQRPVTASEIPGLRVDDPCVDHCTNMNTCTAVAQHGQDQVCPVAQVQGGRQMVFDLCGSNTADDGSSSSFVSGTSARPSLCMRPSYHDQGKLFNQMASHVQNKVQVAVRTQMWSWPNVQRRHWPSCCP
jgi:hypothetical protein